MIASHPYLLVSKFNILIALDHEFSYHRRFPISFTLEMLRPKLSTDFRCDPTGAARGDPHHHDLDVPALPS